MLCQHQRLPGVDIQRLQAVVDIQAIARRGSQAETVIPVRRYRAVLRNGDAFIFCHRITVLVGQGQRAARADHVLRLHQLHTHVRVILLQQVQRGFRVHRTRIVPRTGHRDLHIAAVGDQRRRLNHAIGLRIGRHRNIKRQRTAVYIQTANLLHAVANGGGVACIQLQRCLGQRQSIVAGKIEDAVFELRRTGKGCSGSVGKAEGVIRAGEVNLQQAVTRQRVVQSIVATGLAGAGNRERARFGNIHRAAAQSGVTCTGERCHGKRATVHFRAPAVAVFGGKDSVTRVLHHRAVFP